MPHTVSYISGYACVVYLIIPRLFSETASFYTEIDNMVCQRYGSGRKGYIIFLSKGKEIRLGPVTWEIFRRQGKTKNIYVWKISKLSQTRSCKAHIFILNISAQEHTQAYTCKGNSNQALVSKRCTAICPLRDRNSIWKPSFSLSIQKKWKQLFPYHHILRDKDKVRVNQR